MGTAGFAVPSLEMLVANGLKPVAVATGPDRRRGRGQKVTFTPVKEAALRAGIDTLLQPEHVKDPAFAEAVADLNPDIIVVVAYRILPPAVYECATKGAFNLHGSLLPKYRGAAPINRAVMAGETETGVTTFFLERKVDTGNMIMQRSMLIGAADTAGEVHDRMMVLGAEAVLETVQRIIKGDVQTFQQDDSQATSAPKIFKEDCEIDWSQPASVVHNHIRGLSPYPGAWTTHNDVLLKVYKSEPVAESGVSGCVLDASGKLVIACGQGAIEVLDIQQQGRRRMPAKAFLLGYELEAGDCLQ